MIVGFLPGGSIKDSMVVLQFNQLLPRKYNTERVKVYMEPEGGSPHMADWTVMKPLGRILPDDSPLLSQPELVEVNILDLTVTPEPDSFSHTDIIRFEEEESK